MIKGLFKGKSTKVMNTWTDMKINNKIPKSVDKQSKAFLINVQLFMSAKGLKSLDKLSDSDPFCTLLTRGRKDDNWEFYDKTETVANNLNPQWVKHFDLSFEFHKNKQLKFQVFNDNVNGEHQLIGTLETTVAEILIASKLILTRNLDYPGKKKRGVFTVRADTVFDCDDEAKLAFNASFKSHKILCYGEDNPYLMIERSRNLEDKQMTPRSKQQKLKSNYGNKVEDITNVTDWVIVYKTPYIFETNTPVWDPIKIKMSLLCNNNKKLPIRLSVHSFKNFGTHYCYGSCVTSLREIEMGANQLNLKTAKGKVTGVLNVTNITLNLRPSLLAYLQSGWRISTCVAVDFTLSNKPYDDPRSLHAQDLARVGNMNLYEQAIFEVGDVLEPYSLDGQFGMLGFGGAPNYMTDPQENGKISKCWNLTGAPFSQISSKVKGTGQMLKTYHNAIMQTNLKGPTYFAPLIERFIQIIDQESKAYEKLYFLFVILTDGCIHDMSETKKILVEISYKPVSVIIVGIGNADFTNMNQLDADKVVLTDDDGRVAARDIVQFVPFSQMLEMAKVEVAENILLEVPHHFVDFMVLNEILQPKSKPESQMSQSNDSESQSSLSAEESDGSINDRVGTDQDLI